MLLEGNDEIIVKLNFFQKVKTLSLLKDKFESNFYPEIKSLKSIETIYMSYNSFNNFSSPDIFLDVFPSSLKIIVDPSVDEYIITIEEFLEKYKNVKIDCKLIEITNFSSFPDFNSFLQLSSLSLDMVGQDDKNSIFDEFFRKWNDIKEQNASVSLDHVRSVKLCGLLSEINFPLVFKFLSLLPELQALSLDFYCHQNSLLQILSDNLSQLPKKVKKLHIISQWKEFVLELLKNYPDIEELEIEIIGKNFTSNLARMLVEENIQFKRLEKIDVDFLWLY